MPIGLGTGLEIDSRSVGSICAETEHLLLPRVVGQQQLQLSCSFNEHAGSAEGRRRFDADGGAPCGGRVGLQDHPQSLAGIDPPHRTLRTAQPHLEHNPGVYTSCKTAGTTGKNVRLIIISYDLIFNRRFQRLKPFHWRLSYQIGNNVVKILVMHESKD